MNRRTLFALLPAAVVAAALPAAPGWARRLRDDLTRADMLWLHEMARAEGIHESTVSNAGNDYFVGVKRGDRFFNFRVSQRMVRKRDAALIRKCFAACGTTIQKVEIVVTSNKNPSRIAQQIKEQLKIDGYWRGPA